MNQPKFDIIPDETNREHNTRTKAALELLESNKELCDWAKTHFLAELRNMITNQIVEEGHELSDELMKYGVRLCPKVAMVWIANELENNVGAITEWLAGFAYWEGDSKANLARAVGIRQQSYATHFRQLEEIAAAQNKADETGQDQTISLRGAPFIIHPGPSEEEDQE